MAMLKSRKPLASKGAIELVKRFEGYRRAAGRLQDGRWTIGYGHSKTARAGAEVSEADAEALLIYDLMEVSKSIGESVYTPLNQNQFDALAAFVFNIGADNFRHSVVLRRLNEGAYLQAAYAMEMWRRADFEGESIVVDALVRRRAAEKALFLTPPEGFVPAPSQILRPAFDADCSDRAPSESVELTADLEGEEAVAERIGPLPLFEPMPDPTPEPESQSRTEAAAAALVARLGEMLREDAPPAAEAEPIEEVAPFEAEHAEAPPPEETPVGEEWPEPDPNASLTADDMEQAPQVAGLFTPGTFETTGGAGLGYSVTAYRARRSFSLSSAPGMIVLGVLGLALFVAGLVWSFNTKRSPADGLFTGPWMAGLGVGLVGIVCMAVAIYFLLDRLGGREDG
jgi:lysozyme